MTTVPESYKTGWWSCSYRVTPVANPPTLPSWRAILLEVKGSETGWPVWLSLESRPGMGMRISGDVIECLLGDTDDRDFWRADPKGELFLLRRLQEDTDFKNAQPGTFIDLTLPVWRTGECLLHSSRLATKLGADLVEMEMRWGGLAGRELRALAGPNRSVMRHLVCHDTEVSAAVTATALEIPDTLPALVKALVAPLYARFDFFEPADELYESELHRMRTGI